MAAFDPWFVTAGRAAVAGLLALALLVGLRRPLPARKELGRLAFGALMLVGGFPGFTGLAMLTVGSAHGGVVLGVLPLMTAALGAFWMGDRPPFAFWLVAAAGAGVVLVFTLLQAGGPDISPGDAFLLLAGLSAAAGYVVSADLTRRMPGWETISWMLVLSLPLTLPAALLLLPVPSALGAVPQASWIAFVYVAVMSQFVGFFAWNAGLALGGVARVSQVQLLQTFVTIAIAAVVGGESVDGWTWGAAALVAALVLLGQILRRSPRRA